MTAGKCETLEKIIPCASEPISYCLYSKQLSMSSMILNIAMQFCHLLKQSCNFEKTGIKSYFSYQGPGGQCSALLGTQVPCLGSPLRQFGITSASERWLSFSDSDRKMTQIITLNSGTKKSALSCDHQESMEFLEFSARNIFYLEISSC